MSWLVQGLLLGAAVGVGAALVIGTGGLAAAATVGGPAGSQALTLDNSPSSNRRKAFISRIHDGFAIHQRIADKLWISGLGPGRPELFQGGLAFF